IRYPAGRQPNIAAIDKTEAFHRVEVGEFGTIASHKDRLRAYRSRALSRSDSERMNHAVEWHTQTRCFRTRKIMRMRVPHKRDGSGVQRVVRDISHLYPAISRTWRQPSSRQSDQCILCAVYHLNYRPPAARRSL